MRPCQGCHRKRISESILVKRKFCDFCIEKRLKQADRKAHKKRKESLKRLGRCLNHVDRKPAPGRKLCEECLERDRRYRKAQYERKANPKMQKCAGCRMEGHNIRSCKDAFVLASRG